MIVTVKGWAAMALFSAGVSAALLGLSWTAALCGWAVGLLMGSRP